MNPVKVMLVDDEVLAIEHMKSLISWEALGYEIVCSATRSSQVPELARKHRPDLVIMDIVMPGQDGLALSKTLLAEGTALKIVLLTSYKEFEYAKEAVRLGVASYWVKHEMDADTFSRELGGLREEIVLARREQQSGRERLLVDWLGGRELSDAGWRTATDGRCDAFDRWQLVVLRPDRPPFSLPGMPAPPPLPAAWPDSDDPGLLAALPFLEEYFVLLYGDIGARGEGRLRETAESRAVEATAALERMTGGTVSAASAHGLPDRIAAPGRLAEGLRRLGLSVYHGPRQLYRLNEPLPAPTPTPTPTVGTAGHFDWSEGLASVRALLQEGRYAEAALGLSGLFAQARVAMDVPGLSELCRQLAAAIARCRAQLGLPEPAEAHDAAAWTSVPAIEAAFAARIAELDAAAGAPAASRKVRAAIAYLERHYADPDIGADAVAGHLGISRDHLRHVFKEETGHTVLDRLTEIRMDQAKRLLADGALKIYEIAERVGYRNGQYFSQVFRKQTGMNPHEYTEKRR
ncbi:helix-turn-helix domain-containing protein [Cohnella sp. JJ-181]|uniref:helix-turn-helix domain-containing protein n=1 Tax=Cohnella rhizoplanae TaxID=2974897 RepID=UPI0022FF58B5|nr:helix-turn-helix domain-containing protein [Cohnella sp. JJ-181]CAI6086600.1 HTH-type transcriptional activator RhaR [Cohnella sp. JJ-181]